MTDARFAELIRIIDNALPKAAVEAKLALSILKESRKTRPSETRMPPVATVPWSEGES